MILFVFDVILPICAVLLTLWVGWAILRKPKPKKSNAPASEWPGLRDLEPQPSRFYVDAPKPRQDPVRRRQDAFFYGLPEPVVYEGPLLTEEDLLPHVAAFKSGMGGDFAGGGASGGWDNAPAPTPYRDEVNVPWVNPVTDVGLCRRSDDAPAPAAFEASTSPSPAPAPCDPPAPAPEPAPAPSPSPSYGD